MVKIVFRQAGGEESVVDVPAGWSVMQAAVANGVTGIVGECGGSMACATCHCYVDPAWAGRLGERSPGEADMLELGYAEMRAESRLTCQITVSDDLEGLVLEVAG